MQDMHTLALRTILQGLRVAGVCRGEVDALMDADIGALFMPHGAKAWRKVWRCGSVPHTVLARACTRSVWQMQCPSNAIAESGLSSSNSLVWMAGCGRPRTGCGRSHPDF
eukprot:356965-Chlamydomonas_euryale.AAC.3